MDTPVHTGGGFYEKENFSSYGCCMYGCNAGRLRLRDSGDKGSRGKN